MVCCGSTWAATTAKVQSPTADKRVQKTVNANKKQCSGCWTTSNIFCIAIMQCTFNFNWHHRISTVHRPTGVSNIKQNRIFSTASGCNDTSTLITNNRQLTQCCLTPAVLPQWQKNLQQNGQQAQCQLQQQNTCPLEHQVAFCLSELALVLSEYQLLTSDYLQQIQNIM